MFINEDPAFCDALNARLEKLFYIDGRDNPEHEHHATYTGLARKYNGISVPTTRDENVST